MEPTVTNEPSVAQRDADRAAEQQPRMTARPRRCARFSDEKASSFAIVEVRARAADDTLQSLTGEPRHAGSGEAAGGCTTTAPDSEHRGSAGRSPDRAELRDAAEYGVGGGTAIAVQLLEHQQVELAALWRRRPRGHSESGSGECDGL